MRLLRGIVCSVVALSFAVGAANGADTKKDTSKKDSSANSGSKSNNSGSKNNSSGNTGGRTSGNNGAKDNKAARDLNTINGVKAKDSASARKGFDTPVKDKGVVQAGKTTKQDPAKIARDESAKQRKIDADNARKFRKAKEPPSPGK